jgi:hypothetical protein
MVPMARQGQSIVILLVAIWLAPAAYAGSAERSTLERQDYTYDPRTGTVTLDLMTVYSGHDADVLRALFTNIGWGEYSRAKLVYYRRMYGAIAETAQPVVEDDNERNIIEIREHYKVSLAEPDDDLKHRFPIYPDLLRGFFAQLPATIQQPYALDGALDRRDIVTVTALTLGTYAIQDSAVSDGYFTFTRKASAGAGRVEMDYGLRFLADRVPVTDFAAYTADIARMDHNIFAWIDLDRDVYHRYYRDIPKIIRAVAAIVLVVGAVFARWLLRKRRMGRA